MDTIDYAAAHLNIDSTELREALRRGRIQAEREAHRRHDGAIAYQPITPGWALMQAAQAGAVSRIVFSLGK